MPDWQVQMKARMNSKSIKKQSIRMFFLTFRVQHQICGLKALIQPPAEWVCVPFLCRSRGVAKNAAAHAGR